MNVLSIPDDPSLFNGIPFLMFVFLLALGEDYNIARQPGGAEATGILASIAIGILMDAFLVRSLLVLAAVALLGRWNWWPSSHGCLPLGLPAAQRGEVMSL